MSFKPVFKSVFEPPVLRRPRARLELTTARSPAAPAILFCLVVALAFAGNCLSDPVCSGTDITCNPAATLLYQPVCTGEIQAVFRSDRDGNQEIYAGTPGAFTRRTDSAGTDSQPEWTAGGAGIVFMSQRDGNPEIYTMGADGSNPLRLTNNGGLDITPRSAFSDGRILFTSQRDGNREIYVMHADGSNPTRLTNDPGNDNTPVWALGDSLVLFVSDRSGDEEVYAMNPDGSGLRRLTTDPGADKGPKWSAVRNQIVFSSDRSGADRIYTMDLDGGNLSRLTEFESSTPAPAPCDRRLLVRSNADIQGLNPDVDEEIFLVNPDTGEYQNLSDDPGGDAQPDWYGV